MATLTVNPTVNGDVYKADGSWPPSTGLALGGSQYALARGFNGASYYIYNWFLRFDTSSLDDTAVISSAKLRLYTSSVSAADATAGISGGYYDPGAAVDTGDYSQTIGTDAFSGQTLTNGAYKEITLSSPDSNISKTGFTGFRIQAADFGTPTGNNLSAIDVATNKPELVITYTVPVPGVLSGMTAMSALSAMAI